MDKKRTKRRTDGVVGHDVDDAVTGQSGQANST